MYDFDWVNEMSAFDAAMELSVAGTIQKGVGAYYTVKDAKKRFNRWRDKNKPYKPDPYYGQAPKKKKPFRVSGQIRGDMIGARYQNDNYDVGVSYHKKNSPGGRRLNLSYHRK
jgi:hypothetical protein